MRSKEDEKKFEQMKADVMEALNDKGFRLFSFIAIGNEGVTKLMFGVDNRSDFMLIAGELSESVHTIFSKIEKIEMLEKLTDMLDSNDEKEAPRVLNS